MTKISKNIVQNELDEINLLKDECRSLTHENFLLREELKNLKAQNKELSSKYVESQALNMQNVVKAVRVFKAWEKLKKTLLLLKMYDMDVSKLLQFDYLKYARHCNYNIEQIPSEEDYNFIKDVFEEF